MARRDSPKRRAYDTPTFGPVRQARMFSEGLEPAPLLLDDPFAYWDDDRIERSLPILGSFARNGTQLTIFTTSHALARAAASRGASIVRLADSDESRVRRHAPVT